MKKRYWLLTFVIFILAIGAGLYNLMNSRTYVVFGQMVSRTETTEKLVALTIDDGPDPKTRDVMKVLDDAGIKATFFVCGAGLEKNMDIGGEMVASGHELGNHAYTHQYLIFMSPTAVKQEIEETDRLIREAGYAGEVYFRPPYCKKLFILPWYLAENGRTIVTWDVEPDSNPDLAGDSAAIAEYVCNNVRPGSIILLHAVYSEPSRNAIPEIARRLKEQGYAFVTVSDLLQ